MPVRRLNFTGRKRVNRENVEVFIDSIEDSFELTFRSNLDAYNFPATAEVFLEAHKRTGFQRFDLGTIRKPQPSENLSLTAFSSPVGLKFRLKVVDAANSPGRLLGEVDNIRPVLSETGDGLDESLLPVEPSNQLGNEIFKLDYTADEIHLLVSSSLHDWRAVVRDRAFVTLVFPGLLRQVLMYIVYQEKYREMDDLADWRTRWLKFAQEELKARPIPDEHDFDIISAWVDECVGTFCNKHRVLAKFNKLWEE